MVGPVPSPFIEGLPQARGDGELDAAAVYATGVFVMPEQLRSTGTSFESFEEAVNNAFAEIPGDPAREGLAEADVARSWVTKGGVVGRTQYHVELVSRKAGESRAPGQRR